MFMGSKPNNAEPSKGTHVSISSLLKTQIETESLESARSFLSQVEFYLDALLPIAAKEFRYRLSPTRFISHASEIEVRLHLSDGLSDFLTFYAGENGLSVPEQVNQLLWLGSEIKQRYERPWRLLRKEEFQRLAVQELHSRWNYGGSRIKRWLNKFL